MSGFDNNNDINENLDPKKKQKPGLNAVRPDDFTEQRFKDMAKDQNLSQTEMFNRIFWNYIKDQNSERRQLALNLEAEVNLISKDLNSILNHFKTISEKAQDTIISIETNAEQTEKNLTLDIDTLHKKLEALEKRNAELEKTNEAFTEIKKGLEGSLTELQEELSKKDDELKALKESSKEKDKAIRELEKQAERDVKEIKALQQEKDRHDEETAAKAIRIHNLETANSSLQATIESIESMKKAEIAAIEAKNQAVIKEIKVRLESLQEKHEEAIQNAVNNVKTEMEAEKKLAIAEIKLELAEAKEKLAAAMTKQATGKSKVQHQEKQ